MTPELEFVEDELFLLDRQTLALLVQLDGRRSVDQLAGVFGELSTLKGLAQLVDVGIVAVPPRPDARPRPNLSERQSLASIWSSSAPAIIRLVGWTLVSGAIGLGCWMAPGAAALLLGVLGVGAPIVYLLWHRPEFGLFGLLGLTAGLLRARDLYVPLPFGGLFPADVALLGLFALFGVRALVQEGLRITWWPVSGPLLVFLGVCSLSVGYAVGFRGIELRQALNELRPIAFYTVALLAMLAITRANQLTAILIGLFVLADAIALALVLQQFAGAGSLLLPGMDDWQVSEIGPTDVGVDRSQQDFGTTRIVPAGGTSRVLHVDLCLHPDAHKLRTASCGIRVSIRGP